MFFWVIGGQALSATAPLCTISRCQQNQEAMRPVDNSRIFICRPRRHRQRRMPIGRLRLHDRELHPKQPRRKSSTIIPRRRLRRFDQPKRANYDFIRFGKRSSITTMAKVNVQPTMDRKTATHTYDYIRFGRKRRWELPPKQCGLLHILLLSCHISFESGITVKSFLISR